MSAHNLIHVLRPHQVANLRAGIDAAERRVVHCIPETNATIRRSPSRREESMLMRRPSDRLHRSLVLVVFQNWRGRVQAPGEEFVVISARR